MKVELTDSGSTESPWLLAAAASNTGLYRWTVGDWKSRVKDVYPNGENYKIRVSTLDDAVGDSSDEGFAIGSITSLTVSGLTSVQGGATPEQYSCMAHYDFGPDREVTNEVKWSCTKVKGARMGKGGLLTTAPVGTEQSCTITATYGKGKPPLSDSLVITVTP